MSATTTGPSLDPFEEERVRSWEIARMVELGLPTVRAEALADAGVSWHQVEALLRQGCDARSAFRILRV